jgi:putative transposase
MPSFRDLQQLVSRLEETLLLQNEYHAIQLEMAMKARPGAFRPTRADKAVLGRFGGKMGKKLLQKCVNLFSPDTVLGWHRDLVLNAGNPSAPRKRGRPALAKPWAGTLLAIAQANRLWGYDKLVGALGTLGYHVDKEAVARFLRRHGLTPWRKNSLDPWLKFIRNNLDRLVATDFLTAEVGEGPKPRTYYCLFFIQLDTRLVKLGGITEHPNESWMKQVARNLTSDGEDFMKGRRLLIHDRDTKYCKGFDMLLRNAGCRGLKIPARSPDLNAYAERWVRSVKEECLTQLPLWTENMLWTALREYITFYNHERPHQGLSNQIPDPKIPIGQAKGRIMKKSRLNGLLNFYYREPEDNYENSLKMAA